MIFGMDWLVVNYALVDCFCKEVIFRPSRLLVVVFCRKQRDTPLSLILAFSTYCLLRKGVWDI